MKSFTEWIKDPVSLEIGPTIQMNVLPRSRILYCPLRETLMGLEVGQGFLSVTSSPQRTAVQALTYASKMGIKVTTRKIHGRGLQITRIK